MITKKAKKEYLRNKLATNRTWAERGLMLIYGKQTSDEQTQGDTKYDNKIGFSGAHAEIMSSFAKWVEADRDLTDKQLKIVFKIIPKYWKQIMGECNEKILLQNMLNDGVITDAEFVVEAL